MKKDIVQNFWIKYMKADCLKRSEMIKKMGCFKRMFPLLESKQLSTEHKEIVFNQMLQSYFDDVINTLER